MAYNFFIEKTDSQYLLSIKTKSPPSRYYRKKKREDGPYPKIYFYQKLYRIIVLMRLASPS